MSREAVVFSDTANQFPDKIISPIPVLLIDSDGTIFSGNMKKIISAVIRLLKTPPGERNSIEEFCKKLGNNDLPVETMELLKIWLKTQEDFQLPWSIPAEELYEIQKIIAEFFPLIKSMNTTLTALDIFKMVMEKNGVVMVLTFNIYAPFTIRHSLIKKGLSVEAASKIKIICPESGLTTCHEDGIYTCPLSQENQTLNKNAFIEEAKKICCDEFKLFHCQYIFADDQHTLSAQLKWPDLSVVNGNYGCGQHLEILKNYIKDDAGLESKQHHQDLDNSYESGACILDIVGENKTPQLKYLNLPTGGDVLKTHDDEQDEVNSMRKMSFELTPLDLSPRFPQTISPMDTKKFGQSINFFPAETSLPGSSPDTMSDSTSDENLNRKIHHYTIPITNISLSPLTISSSMDSIEQPLFPEYPVSEPGRSPLARDPSRNQLSPTSLQKGEENPHSFTFESFKVSKSNSMSDFPLVGRQSPPKLRPAVNSSSAQKTEKPCCCLIL